VWKFLPRHGTGIVLLREHDTWLAFSVLGWRFGISAMAFQKVVTLAGASISRRIAAGETLRFFERPNSI